jgi:putative transposase
MSEGIPDMALPVYSSDLTDAEWALLSPLLPSAKPGGRPRTIDLRRILNDLFYLVRTGCAWRYLPRDYGPWSTVYLTFRRVS